MPRIDLVSGFSLGLLGPYLEQHRASLDAVLAAAGLAGERFDAPFAMIGATKVAQVLDTAARLTRDDDFGIGYGEYFALRGAAIMGQLHLTAPTVRDLLQATVEFAPLSIPAASLDLVEQGETAAFTAHLVTLDGVAPRQFAEFLLAVLITRIRRGAGARWQPLAVDLAYQAPTDQRHLRHLLGDTLRFDQSSYRIEFDRRTLDIAFSGVPIGPFEMTRAYLRRLLKRAPYLEQTIEGGTRRVIARRLAEDLTVALDDVAAELGRSARSLQVRLDQEGQTYEAVLLETRKELAQRYLRDTDLPMSEIAARLGFKVQSVLSRWMATHFSETPTAARKRLRRDRITAAAEAMVAVSLQTSPTDEPKQDAPIAADAVRPSRGRRRRKDR